MRKGKLIGKIFGIALVGLIIVALAGATLSLALMGSPFAFPRAGEVLAESNSWTIETVDSAGDVGVDTSLAFDTEGNPTISYYDSTNGDLKYAYWNGTSWHIQTVDSGGDVGQANCLAFDAAGNPAVVYYDATNRALKYGHWNGASWDICTVDSAYWSYRNSLIFDASARLAIAYYDYPACDLKYAEFNGTSWNKQTVYDDGLGTGWGRTTSLALDSSGDPAIAIRHPTVGLRYAHWNGASWNIETVDSGYGTGAEASLKFDASGNPAIAYSWQGVYGGPGSLRYAHFNGTTWDIETLDDSGSPLLAFDPSGNPAMSYYYAGTNKDLKYAHFNGSTWDIETVDSQGDVGQYSSLAFNSFGNPAISYYDATNGDLKCAFGLGAGDTTPPTVSSVSPNDGAPNVPVDTVVTATFSEAMDSSTITSSSFTLAGSAVSGTVTYNPATYTATFTPDAALDYNHTYTATLSTTITDAAGNPLAAAYSWSFTTELEPFKFKIGDWVRSTANLNVREGPGLGYTIIDTMPLGTKGQILGGPVEADGFFWWDVEYAVGVRGWSAENWLELDVSEAPTCVVKLEMDGAGIDEVGVWEFFDIHVGDSASDIGIKQVRFSSDNVRDGYPTGEWTEWFDWNVSSEDWDATTKTKCWAFDTAGYKEVWAEVEDEMGHTAFGRATIFVPAPALPVLTSPLVITPAKDIYNVGDSLEAELTIKNIGDVPITLDVLTVGGRLNGFIPPEGAPDFTFRSVTLLPNEPYRYQGSLELDQIGQYHFFVAYQIESPTPDEKKLLDENNWNTCVDLGEGLTHASRVKNIIVYEEGVVPEEPSKLRDEIDRWKESHLRYQYPAYLRDADSFTSALATLWTSFTSFVTRTDLTKAYDDLYFTGIEYQWLSFQALMDAERSLESGNVETARKCLENSHMYWRLSAMSFSAAAEVFAGSLEAGAILAKGIKDGCQAAVTVGVAIVYPPAAPKVDAIYMSIDFVITTKVEGVDQATKDVITKLITKWLLKGLKFTSLSDSTLEAYVNRVGTEVRLDTLLANQEFMTEFGLELRNVITDRVIDEVGIWISEELIEEIVKDVIDSLESLINSVTAKQKSPVELRVLDSKGRITGLTYRTVRHGIPMSLYHNGTVSVHFPDGAYRYEVTGTDIGIYGLEIAFSQGAETFIFTAIDIPIICGAMHQYTIDWDAVSQGDQGVTVQIDSDGDGEFEDTFTSDDELTRREFVVETTPPAPPMVPTMDKWGIVAMITLFAGLLVWMVRRRRFASRMSD